MKTKETALVRGQEQIAEDIFDLRLGVSFAGELKAGQFVSLFPEDQRRLLPRPISVCGADPEKGEIRLVYRRVGEGTRAFSSLAAGDRIPVMGPLGNGFPVDKAAGKKVLLIGGGIGIPPMLSCAAALREKAGEGLAGELRAAVGYRTNDPYLLKEMEELCPVTVSTDDGSLGYKGTVLDAIRKEQLRPELIFACGPKVMLRAVKQYAEETGAQCFVSLEERMACGVGACLGCVCRTKETDPHAHVPYARVCTDGPVFPAGEVDLS